MGRQPHQYTGGFGWSGLARVSSVDHATGRSPVPRTAEADCPGGSGSGYLTARAGVARPGASSVDLRHLSGPGRGGVRLL